MPFQIIRNDITNVTADAIVNTANPEPMIGGGTDSAIYTAAGEQELLAARKKIGAIAPGHAVSTPAFHLHAKYVIHTVGPAWIDGEHGEVETLHACYRNALALAAELSCESIAFPLIATGVYGFPKAEALQIALSEINKFLLEHEMNVILVVFDRNAFTLSSKLVGDIEQFIDEHEMETIREDEYARDYHSVSADRSRENIRSRESSRGFPFGAFRRRKDSEEREDMRVSEDSIAFDELEFAPEADAKAAVLGAPVLWEDNDALGGNDQSLDELLQTTEDTFQQRLFKLIDERGMDDVTVYKKANIDRKVFSKIRGKVDYRPKKKTAVALALALELDLSEMKDLLSRAEIAFSPSNKFDLIITYFITHKNYNIFEINAALFEYGQPILC